MERAERAEQVRRALPAGGLFAHQQWRTALDPFRLDPGIARDIENLGRILLQFYRSVNLLYRRSVEGRSPGWVAELLDQGKSPELLSWQRNATFRNELPRVIRPDLLLTEEGLAVTELDSVPGGIGLTQWLNETYSHLPAAGAGELSRGEVLGGATGMRDGFGSIFGNAARVHLVVSAEAASYRPEMDWLAESDARFQVRDTSFMDFQPGDAVYRFFELFDLPNVANAGRIFEMAARKEIRLTPPLKPIFEEKLLFALLWNRNLQAYWRQELGESFFQRLLRIVPRSWVLDPAPLPPHGAYPELDLTDWQQLKNLSQRDRDLILKISGYSETAWGARGVSLGSDLSAADWGSAVDRALQSWPASPYVLQRYHKPRLAEIEWFDFEARIAKTMKGRVRLCPYFFVSGDGDAIRSHLGGVLATICPADKKIIHGMTDAVLAPCAVGTIDPA
ncbi:MAG: hypothetical protein EXS36_15040 [Pedosphaera sp.]|nr:hypothetical protein [Pedosphaera sp.]